MATSSAGGPWYKQLSALINHSCSFHWAVFWRVITRAAQGADSCWQGRPWLRGIGEGPTAAPSNYPGGGCEGGLAGVGVKVSLSADPSPPPIFTTLLTKGRSDNTFRSPLR